MDVVNQDCSVVREELRVTMSVANGVTRKALQSVLEVTLLMTKKEEVVLTIIKVTARKR